MKFVGFWTSYLELCRHSLVWFKDYWLLSIIFTILGMVMVIFVPSYVSNYINYKKLSKIGNSNNTDKN